ncbi:hypothetical protein MMC25_002642 [Agyrium rufum]|nr:hypothetical protein [Agyrium rufum]
MRARDEKDEYVGLEHTHPQSYHTFMHKHFFAHVDVLPQNVHILNGMAEDLEAECQAYDKTIAAHGGIDLFLSGIGPNGHIAFNEPYSSLTSRTHVQPLSASTISANARFFGNETSKVPKRALTVGVQTIMNAKEVIVIATGTGKANAVKGMIEGPVRSECMGSVLQGHGNTRVVLDEEACVELKWGTVKYFKHIEEIERSVGKVENYDQDIGRSAVRSQSKL